MCEVDPNSVLVVDDDPTVRALLSRQLEQEGFETREAEDGIEGLMKLRNELPGAIISDLQMPRMSGFEFVSVVRRRFPCIPVIVLSGSIPDDVPAEAGPDVWFEKGALDFDILMQTLRDLVRRTPEHPDLPQVVTIPVRTRRTFTGHFILTCTDCLRKFVATSARENKAVAGTAVCVYCDARVPFLIENSTPD